MIKMQPIRRMAAFLFFTSAWSACTFCKLSLQSLALDVVEECSQIAVNVVALLFSLYRIDEGSDKQKHGRCRVGGEVLFTEQDFFMCITN